MLSEVHLIGDQPSAKGAFEMARLSIGHNKFDALDSQEVAYFLTSPPGGPVCCGRIKEAFASNNLRSDTFFIRD